MKKLLALLLLFGIVGCATPVVENALYAYSEKKQKKVLVGVWAADFCSEYLAEKYNRDIEIDFLLDCKYELIDYAREESFRGSSKFSSGTYRVRYENGSSTSQQEYKPNLNNNNKWDGLLVEVLRAAIIAYPEAKAKAEREAAIRRNAYIKGQNDGRASCRGSTSC